MKRPSQKGHMPPDWFSAGKTADRLVYHRLKDGSGEILLCGALVDQGLNVRFGKYAAPGGNRVEGTVIFGVFVKPACIRLKKGSHLINKGTGSSRTDPVHTLLHITALKIDDLGILAAKLDCHIRLRGKLLESRGHADHLLHERNL